MLNLESYAVGSPLILRWLILLTFPVIGMVVVLGGMGIQPLVMYGLAWAMCAALLHRLGQPGPETAAVWLVLAIFIVFYFLRYPIIAFDPMPVIATHPNSISDSFRDEGVGLNRALNVSTLAFCVFCAVATLLLGREKRLSVNTNPISIGAGSRVIKFLLIFVPLLMLVLGGSHMYIGLGKWA